MEKRKETIKPKGCKLLPVAFQFAGVSGVTELQTDITRVQRNTHIDMHESYMESRGTRTANYTEKICFTKPDQDYTFNTLTRGPQ
jgi:hypothetical protein